MRTLVVILAGGEGRRIGGAKPLRQLGAGRLIDRAVSLARSYAPDVAISVRAPAQAPDVEARLILDDAAIPGPLAALAAGLAHGRAIGAERVLAIACDMPLLPPDLAERLHAALDGCPRAMAAVASSGGRLHPSASLWRIQAGERLPAYIEGGRSSLRGFAEACGSVVAAWPAADADPFTNVNTPEDLRALHGSLRLAS